MAVDLSEVLAAVNQIRAERGIGEPLAKLPGGKTGYTCCPIAKALECGVVPSSLDFRTDGNYEELPMPEVIGEFVVAFDSGEFPELEED